MSYVISKDGTKIAYSKIGKGPAIILVDGALCYRASGPSQPLAELLKTDYTVYSYDRRGRGESDNTLPYAVEREIEDIEALIKLAGGKVFLYGVSSGTALSLDAANRLDGILKVATFEAPFIVDNSAAPRPADLLDRFDNLVALNKRADAVILFMRTVGMPAIFANLMRFTPAWPKLTSVAHTLPYDFRVLGDTGGGKALSRTRWTNVKIPALVMDGGKSPTYMRNSQKAIAEVLANAEYRTLPGQTHLLQAEAVAPVLKEFFVLETEVVR